MGGSYTVADAGVIQRLVGDADRHLAARCSEFRGEGITAEFRIGHGDVVQSILSVAQSEGVDPGGDGQPWPERPASRLLRQRGGGRAEPD